MTRFGNHGVWSLSLASVMAVIGVITSRTDPTLAQIVPDQTLGAEQSQVMPNVDVRGGLADRIDGGAVRGVNLFHSFGEFNVRELQRVYFANPEGIENILGRVTGSNRSDILGTLGVDGGANLFLINPNGIVFGPNAQLDIRGSFIAGTADRFKFPDGSEFRATNPNAPPLVTVNIPIGLQYGSDAPAALVSEADLAVGRDLLLSGGSVTSTGELSAPQGQVVVEGVAGDVQVRDVTAQSATLRTSQDLVLEESQLRTTGDMSLLAQQTVRVRDSVEQPFVAQAGGQLLVQGNQEVDIFALNHPSSGLFSGGNMTLRSTNTVGGDAHYTAGGSFQIEQLDGSPGSLFSPYDPVIRANGNVRLASYKGASLHILAGGSVTIEGNVEITRPDTGNGNFLAENIVLSDGTTVAINGSTEPTLDIRAGIDWTQLPGNTISGIVIPQPSFETGATSADISIGSITNILYTIDGIPYNGQVLLTNQYKPNQDLRGGTIEIKEVDDQGNLIVDIHGNSISAFGNPVTIDARGDIKIADDINSGIAQGTAGDIRLLSGGTIDTHEGNLVSQSDNGDAGDITLRAIGSILTADVRSFVADKGTGDAGDIILFSQNGSIDTSRGQLISSTANGRANGGGGNVTLDAASNITTAKVESFVGAGGTGRAGDINFLSRSGYIDTTGGSLSSSTASGRGGNVTLDAAGNITTAKVESFVGAGGTGRAGDITLLSRDGNITLINTDEQGSTIRGSLSSSTANGQGGNVTLTALVGNITTADIESEVRDGGIGFAGDITLISQLGNIDTTLGALSSSTRSNDNNSFSGDVTLRADGQITTANITSASERGYSGDIFLNSTGLNGSIDTSEGELRSSSNAGRAGNVTLTADSQIITDNIISSSFSPTDLNSRSGNIAITSRGGGGGIDTSRGELTSSAIAGQAGDVLLDAVGKVTTADITSESVSGNSGDIIIKSRERGIDTSRGDFLIGTLNSSTTSGQFAGNVTLTAAGQIITENITSESESGNSGNIDISSSTGGITTGGFLNSKTAYGSFAGNVILQALGQINTTDITSSAEEFGYSGDIFLNSTGDAGGINTSAGTLRSNTNSGIGGSTTLIALGQITTATITSTSETGSSGTININSTENGINTSAGTLRTDTNLGNAGGISLNANLDVVTADITSTSRTGISGNIYLSSNAGSIDTTLGELSTETKEGRAGDVFLNANLDLMISHITASSGGSQKAGDLTLTSNRDLSIVDGIIRSQTSGTGSGGDITLTADSISLRNSQLSASTSGRGNSGSVSVTANGGTVSLEDNSSIETSVEPGAEGNGSDITVNAGSVFLRSGSRLEARTRGSGIAGNIFVNASDTVKISGFSSYEDNSGVSRVALYSGILTSTETPNSGEGGNITVGGLPNDRLDQLEVSDGGVLSALTRSIADGGDITVDVNILKVTNGGQLITSASEFSGDAGNILVDATESITISGSNPNFANSGGSSGSINPTSSGNVTEDESNNSRTEAQFISFELFSLQENSDIESSTSIPYVSIFSPGNNPEDGDNPGDNSFDYYSFEIQTPGTRGIFDIDYGSGSTDGQGNVDTELFLFDGNGNLLVDNDDSSIDYGASGSTSGLDSYISYDFRSPGTYFIGVGKFNSFANNGSIEGQTLNVGDTYTLQLSLEASAPNPNQGANSGLFAQANGTGNAGKLTLNTRELTVNDEGIISAATTSGIGSEITLQGLDTLEVNNSLIEATTETGVAGKISIDASDSVTVNNGLISSSSSSGVAGDVTINALESVTLSGIFRTTPTGERQGGVLAEATAGGRAGSLTINTDQLTIQNEAAAAVNSKQGSGNAGDILIEAEEVRLNSGGQIAAETNAGGGGDPDNRANITLRGLETLDVNNGLISSSTQTGVAGSVLIDASDSVTVNNGLISSSSSSGVAGDVTINALESVMLSGIFRTTPTGEPQGGVLAEATAGGKAGSVNINTEELTIQNGAAAAVSSREGSGNAGDILIEAEEVTLNSGGEIAAETNAGGGGDPENRANITLRGLETLEVNNGLISSSTQTGVAGSVSIDASDSVTVNNGLISSSSSSGVAGDVTINALESVMLSGIFRTTPTGEPQGGVLAEATAGGKAGSVNINTEELTIQNEAAAAVSSRAGSGNAGDILIEAEEVTLNSGGRIEAQTDAGGSDRPANITLQGLENLDINNGLISSSTESGVAGSVSIDVSDSVTINNGSISSSSNSGRAGSVSINAFQLELDDGTISASTTSINPMDKGVAGNVSINASDSVDLDNGSRIAVTADGDNGTAGDVSINTGDFLVRDGSEVSVSSKGVAGSLNVNADFIGLNQGRLTAEAGQGEGGANINLDVSGFLRLDNESLISALAKGNATGGNININAQYVLASFPTGSEGSDIVANAELGNGGRITINALGIFGLEFRPAQTPLNDITASSQGGAAGTVQITTLGIDPSRGLAALPLNFIDVSGLVGGQCSASGADGELSQFTIIGRGGLPLNPTDPLAPEAEASDWVTFDPESDRISPQAHTPIRITPFTSSVTPQQLAQFPSLCYQSWSTSAIAP